MFLIPAILKYDINDLKAFEDHSGDSESKNDKDNWKFNQSRMPMIFYDCRKRDGGMPEDCHGKYDPSIYTQLDNICEDCYNLYKEPDVHQFCR